MLSGFFISNIGFNNNDILNEERYSGETGADEIERTIQVLQNVVSFNVPLLLKPIFDIKNPDSI